MANVCETERTRQRREAKNAFTIRTLANRAPSRQRENKNGCAAQRETHFGAIPLSGTMTGSSSIMYWVLPITPHIGTPVAAQNFFDMLSPVWQPQLFATAPRAKSRP